jgi:hypothetical protein
MQLDPRRKSIPFWKQDVVALFLILIYITSAFGAMQAWSFLSDRANAFVSNVEPIHIK